MNLNYLKTMWIQSISQFFIYRLTSILVCIFGVLFTAIEVISVLLIYNYTDSVNGWDFYSFLTLSATYTLISYIYQFFFTLSHEELIDKIIEGELDYDLIRPVDSQLINSIKKMDIASLINIIIAILLLCFSVPKILIGQNIILGIGMYILFVLLGVYLYYLVNQFFINFSFWIERPYQISAIPEYLLDIASRPRNVYPPVLHLLFVWVLPILLSTNLPVEIVRGEFSFLTIGYYILFIAVFTILVRIQWQQGLKKYQSTN
ncbi:ABC-2 family transporter protein [Metasolibacillus sp. FSL K6-0083]|uniref:ABC transporter permease n=1 Tax=Metasolibacillus sp. FSL K6-0083 TaxID=2921416 RepID=UPI00315A6133